MIWGQEAADPGSSWGRHGFELGLNLVAWVRTTPRLKWTSGQESTPRSVDHCGFVRARLQTFAPFQRTPTTLRGFAAPERQGLYTALSMSAPLKSAALAARTRTDVPNGPRQPRAQTGARANDRSHRARAQRGGATQMAVAPDHHRRRGRPLAMAARAPPDNAPTLPTTRQRRPTQLPLR